MKKCVFRVFLMLILAILTGCLSLSGPKTSEEYRERGGAYFEQEDLTKALEDFNKAIELDPNNARAYYNRGMVYYHIDSKMTYYKKEAIAEFKMALQIDPNFVRAGYALAYLGATYYDLSDYENARKYGKQSLKKDPENQLALFLIQELDKMEQTREDKTIEADKIQEKIDAQFPEVDKDKYEEILMTQEVLMGGFFGLGSSIFEVGKRYKTTVLTGQNSAQYGAIYTNSVQTFVDSNKRVLQELTTYNEEFYIYFKVNRISGNDHFITLEYIELNE